MRILHVYKDFPPVLGGIENHLRDLAVGQAAAGHEVTVLVTARGPRSKVSLEGGVRVVRAGRLATVASTPISLGLVRELRRLRPDVTHLHIPYPWGEAAWLMAGRHPMVATYHSDVVRQRALGILWAPALHRLLARADRVLATSPRYAATSRFLALAPRVQIVPLGIDPTRFEAAGGPGRRRRTPKSSQIVFVGRLRYYKGLDVLLEALRTLPFAQLAVAGVGPMEAQWRRRAQELEVAPRVTWLGDVAEADLPAVYAAGDVFALPAVARSEAFGMVLLEAMASGLPVVTTELGTGTSFVVVDGETGRVVPAGDPLALGRALKDILTDASLGRRWGQAGQRRVRALFTLDRVLSEVEDVYDEVTTGRGIPS